MRFSAVALGAIFLIGMTGLSSAQALMTDPQLQQKLQSEGYTNVQIAKHTGNRADVIATKDGKSEKFSVNSATGDMLPAKE